MKLFARFVDLINHMHEPTTSPSNKGELSSKANSDPMKEALADYQKLLDNSALSGSGPKLVPNSGKEHAALMMAKMFNETQSSFKMIAGDFCGQVSDDPGYLAAAQSALDRGVRGEIIVLDEANNTSKALTLFRAYLQTGQVRLLQGNDRTKQAINERLKPKNPAVHFAVFDNDKFRLEINPENFSAIGGFHHGDVAGELNGVFDNATATCTPFTA